MTITTQTAARWELELRRQRLRIRRHIAQLRAAWQRDGGDDFQGAAIGDAQVDRILAAEPLDDPQPDDPALQWLELEIAQLQERDDADAADTVILSGRRVAGEGPPPETRHTVRREEVLRTHPPPAQDDRLDEARPILSQLGTRNFPLDALAVSFGLTAFERDVVMLLFAAELDSGFELLFGYMQDDVSRKYVSPHLAGALFGEGPQRAFSIEGPLRRFALLHVEPPPQPAMPFAARPLRLDERVVDHLRGGASMPDGVAELLRPVESGPLSADHAALAASLDGETAINLTGPPQSGKETLAHAIAARAKRTLLRLDPRRLPPLGAERTTALRALEREARLLRLMLFVQPPEREDLNSEVAMQDIVDTLDAPLIVDTRDAWGGARRLIIARVARPDRNAQRVLWATELGSPAEVIDDLVEQFDFSPEMIARAAAAVLRSGDRSSRALWDICQQQVSWRIDDLAQRITTRQHWDELVLDDDATMQLREIASQVAQRARVYERWGFAARLSRGRGITALFAGSSGTGKTMAAEIIAGELGLELYRVDLAGVVSKYIGESEKNLRRVFDAAEQSGAILFFDEADALFGKRTEVKDSHDLYANIQVNYLLQRMEDYRGLAILATNRKSALDRAFLRRLRFIIDFPFPDAKAREHIWRNAFPQQAPVGALDFEFLARLEIAGGNIRNIALNAAFLAAADAEPTDARTVERTVERIDEKHVMHAVRREYAKIQKLVTEGEFGEHFRGRS